MASRDSLSAASEHPPDPWLGLAGLGLTLTHWPPAHVPVEHAVPSGTFVDVSHVEGSFADAHRPTATQRLVLTSLKLTHSLDSAAQDTMPQRPSSSLLGS
jgi:hypothetical protein